MTITRRSRSTGTTVTLEDMGSGYPDGRWMTICEDHGGCVCHPTRKLSEQWLSHPENWCQTCQENSNKA